MRRAGEPTFCGSPGRTWPPRAEAVPVTRRLFESIGSAPKLYHAFVHHLFIARPPTHFRWILERKVYRKPQRSQKTSWTGWRLLATVGSAVSYGHTFSLQSLQAIISYAWDHVARLDRKYCPVDPVGRPSRHCKKCSS
jgi:hypothetical protein